MPEQPATRIDAHFIAAGKYHDIDYPRLEILKMLAEHPHIRTTVAADYSGLERLDQCRFLITYTCDLMPTGEQAAQLRAWLEKGWQVDGPARHQLHSGVHGRRSG
jgi:hypothetical protein